MPPPPCTLGILVEPDRFREPDRFDVLGNLIDLDGNGAESIELGIELVQFCSVELAELISGLDLVWFLDDEPVARGTAPVVDLLARDLIHSA